MEILFMQGLVHIVLMEATTCIWLLACMHELHLVGTVGVTLEPGPVLGLCTVTVVHPSAILHR